MKNLQNPDRRRKRRENDSYEKFRPVSVNDICTLETHSRIYKNCACIFPIFHAVVLLADMVSVLYYAFVSL